MKRKLVCLLMAVTLMLALVACATPDATDESGTERIHLNMAAFADGTGVVADMWALFLTEAAELFPNVDITFEHLPSGSPEELIMSRVAGGDFPDLMWVFQPALLIDGGIVQELPDSLKNLLIRPDDFLVNDRLYIMPMHIGAIGAWYNKEIFAQAGITSAPTNWEEYMATLRAIAAIGIEPIGMAGRDGWYIGGHWKNLWAPVTYGPDPNWSMHRTQGEVRFNNPVTRRSLERLRETMPYWQSGAMSATNDEVWRLFLQGDVAILINGGTWQIPQVDNGDIVIPFEVGFMIPPQDRAEDRRINSFHDNLFVINSQTTGERFDAAVNLLHLYFSSEFYPIALNAASAFPSVRGFDDFEFDITHPTAIAMFDEVLAAINEVGTVPHAHAAQGDNMWPAGAREMAERIVQDLAAGNDDLDALMDMFDDAWDVGVRQAQQG